MPDKRVTALLCESVDYLGCIALQCFSSLTFWVGTLSSVLPTSGRAHVDCEICQIAGLQEWGLVRIVYDFGRLITPVVWFA